jgi:hypothetical protein
VVLGSAAVAQLGQPEERWEQPVVKGHLLDWRPWFVAGAGDSVLLFQLSLTVCGRRFIDCTPFFFYKWPSMSFREKLCMKRLSVASCVAHLRRGSVWVQPHYTDPTDGNCLHHHYDNLEDGFIC